MGLRVRAMALARLWRAARHPRLIDRATGRQEVCEVLALGGDGGQEYEIEVRTGRGSLIAVRAEEDYEEALRVLRARLEERGLLLAINRYRRDAFVSSMARQMSDGLSCYLVRMGRPVKPPRRVVGSLDAAPARRVVTRAEADAFVERWIESCR